MGGLTSQSNNAVQKYRQLWLPNYLCGLYGKVQCVLMFDTSMIIYNQLNTVIMELYKYVLLFCLASVTTSEHSYKLPLCNVYELNNEFKETNISNPVDRQVLLGVFDFQECLINTTILYEKLIVTLREIKVIEEQKLPTVINIKFKCSFNIKIHFSAFDVNTSSNKLNVDLGLLFKACVVSLSELDIFLNFGQIVMIQTPVFLAEHTLSTNCSYATSLQSILVQVDCENYNTKNAPKFFWDSCDEIFQNVLVLCIKGYGNCKIKINPETLQNKFPNLQCLILEQAIIEDHLHFPWAAATVARNIIQDTLKVFFDSFKDIYFYQMFPGNSLLLSGCEMDLTHIQLYGETDYIAFSDMGLFKIDHEIFHNITIKQTINLSQNNLKLLDPRLFQRQENLLYLFLQENKLTSLNCSVFSSLKHLKYINLNRNNIQILDNDPFKSLFFLEEVNLRHNLIKHLPRHMFKDQIDSIRYISFRYNPLQDIPVWPLYAVNFRGLDIRNAEITGFSIVRLLEQINKLDIAEKLVETQLAIKSVVPGSSPAAIDLSFNKITTIPSANMTYHIRTNLQYLLSNFIVSLEGNPFTCNCDTSVIHTVVTETPDPGQMAGPISQVVCVKPPEFKGRYMWQISDEEKYCPIELSECPIQCKCYKRKLYDTVIIDCRNVLLTEMPRSLPTVKLELWFQGSNISEVSTFPYLENVTVLNLANNQLKDISPNFVNKMKALKILYIESNHLTSIPIQLRSLNLTRLTISGNPFVCDCKLRWLKTWLLDNENVIKDWTNVECMDNSDTLKQLIAVPDSTFVCIPDDGFSVTEHVFLPSSIIGSCLFVFVVISLMVYFQKFKLKVLLFIYFNVHPFDKEKETNENSMFDAVAIYSQEDQELKEKVTNHLTDKGYKTADLYRNSLIGYTYIENIERLIKCSSRVIMFISDTAMENKLLQMAWTLAYDKAMSTSLKTLILISDNKVRYKPNLDETLQQLLKTKHFNDQTAKLLVQKVEYLMPKLNSLKNTGIPLESCRNSLARHNSQTENDTEKLKVHVSYPDNLHVQMKNEIIPFLSEHNFDVKLLDMEFTPGADIREDIQTILDTSHHFIFVASEETLADEVTMFILTQALTKTQLENHNYLLLCTHGQINIEDMPNNLSRYVENYVTISINNPVFRERILESITNVREDEREYNTGQENVPLI